MKKIILILVNLIPLTVLAHGGNCACTSFSGVGLAGPIITIPALTPAAGTTSFSLGLGFTNSGRLSQQQITQLSNTEAHGHDLYGSLTPTASISHAFTDKFNLLMTLPYRINFDFRDLHIHDGEAELEDAGDSIGFGDLTLLAQYQILNLPEHNLQAALLGGLKLPTGQSNIQNNLGEQFEFLNQPGSGSWDPLWGAAISKQLGQWSFDSSFLYRFTTEDSYGREAGDIQTYNAAISYAIRHKHNKALTHNHNENINEDVFLAKVFPQHLLGQHLAWDLVLETSVFNEESPEINEQILDNHGGVTMLVNPGMRVTINDRLIYNISLGFPVLENLNGEQGGSDFRLLMGIGTTL